MKPGSPSQVWSKPGDANMVPNSLWPLGATWVQIPPPALKLIFLIFGKEVVASFCFTHATFFVSFNRQFEASSIRPSI